MLMLSTFNCSVGLIIVVSQEAKERVIRRINEGSSVPGKAARCGNTRVDRVCYEIGVIGRGEKNVNFQNHIDF